MTPDEMRALLNRLLAAAKAHREAASEVWIDGGWDDVERYTETADDLDEACRICQCHMRSAESKEAVG